MHANLYSIAAVMQGFSADWAFCGGWALDLALNRVTRNHQDVDIAVWRTDQEALRDYLRGQGWAPEIAHKSQTQPWDGGWLALPHHTLWWRHPTHQPDFLEVLLNERDSGRYVHRRDPAMTLPADAALRPTASGWHALAPEIVLLYKATDSESAKNQADFHAVLPHLDAAGRAWLHKGLHRLDPAHPWLYHID